MIADPIFAAIAAHRAAYDALRTCPDEVSDAACDVCLETESDMLATTPTSLGGLRALVEYADQRRVEYDGIPTAYFPAILAACRALSPIGGAA